MGTDDKVAEQGVCKCPDLRSDLLGSGPVGHVVWVVDVSVDSPHW